MSDFSRIGFGKKEMKNERVESRLVSSQKYITLLFYSRVAARFPFLSAERSPLHHFN